MSVILRYVLCNEEAAVVKETFFDYLRISDSFVRFLRKSDNCNSNCLIVEVSHNNGANMKGKHSKVQARMLDINLFTCPVQTNP